MRQQQLENYLKHIEGIVDAAVKSGNYVTAILQIKGVLNSSGLKPNYEEATPRQQMASIKRDIANNFSGQ